VEIGKITVQRQPWQKLSETPISINKLGSAVNVCGPSSMGGTGRRILSQPRHYPKKGKKKEEGRGREAAGGGGRERERERERESKSMISEDTKRMVKAP
jgi:hypothetical protein